ncbi:response regulator transcription factor [Paenibacillus soyae]|uniref:Response regulator transcription factor n=1 Tax=Paenibacillus soyae TaxID=2969249 RepID=A0A9X2SBK0_9BACL|nr:response regulator transcription factor [Paenibacillus soyae]MCR2805718.1 response regulator transcription factor [Paenibacillus soyae]
MAETVLVVEDDEDIMDILSAYLRKHGFSVLSAVNGKEAMRLYGQGGIDLMLTDIVLPDTEGTELAERIRKQSDMPIIMMSCKREAEDIVNGLELGADDYITKPFEPSVVVARIKSVLRRRNRTGPPQPGALLWKDERLEIDQAACEARVNGQVVHLYAKEMQLLLLLASHPDQVFHVDQLYEQVWGWDKQSDTGTVMVHIRNLRKKIEEDPAAPTYIATVRGFGYKFKAR